MNRSIYAFGTICTISFNNADLMEQIIELLNDLDNKFSLFKENSTITKINNSSSFTLVDKYTLDIIKESEKYSKITKGYFDITVGALSILLKNGVELKINKKLINYKNIIIKKNKIKLKYKGTKIDLGGIAKGYASDLIINILNKNNIKDGIIDLGGNIHVLSNNKIGIQDPFYKENIIGFVDIDNNSVVTSGNYERGLHIIDPIKKTSSISDLLSVTVIGVSSKECEFFSTALFAMKEKKALKFIKKHLNNGYILINNKEILVTKNIIDKFNLLNNSYTLKEI